MKALIYLSETKYRLTNEELVALSNQATIANDIHKITGYLWYHQKRFIQYIEGQEQAVDQLMENISTDNRHIVRHYISEDIQQRRFASWSMNHLGLKREIGSGTKALLKSQLIMLDVTGNSNIELTDKIWTLADTLTERSDWLFSS